MTKRFSTWGFVWGKNCTNVSVFTSHAPAPGPQVALRPKLAEVKRNLLLASPWIYETLARVAQSGD